MANGEFTDKVKILIKAGDGGDGMNSFKAFKGKPACGPDGGDGGRGGNVYFVGDKDMNDLFSFRFTWKFFAEDGEQGGTNQCAGKGGKNVYIKVPLGTLVRDAGTEEKATFVLRPREGTPPILRRREKKSNSITSSSK